MARLLDRDGFVSVVNDQDLEVLRLPPDGTRYGARRVVSLLDYAKGTGQDEGAKIQEAINAARYGTLYVPSEYDFASAITLNVGYPINIVGDVGAGYFFGSSSYTHGARIRALAGLGANPLMKVSPLESNKPVIAPVIENLALDAAGIASHALRVEATVQGVFRNIALRAALTSAFYSGQTSLGGYTGLNYTYGCEFGNIWVDQNGASYGDGLQLDGNHAGSGDTTFCEFKNVLVNHLNGVGIKVICADSNILSNLDCSRQGGGAGIGIELMAASGGGNSASNNVLTSVWAGQGGITARAGATPSVNVIFGLNLADAAPLPVVEAGASLAYYLNTGKLIRLANGVLIVTGAASPEGVVAAPVGSQFYREDGGAGTSLYVKQTGSGNTGWVGK